MPKELITKVIARTGIASRRSAKDLFEKGLVRLNGKITKDFTLRIDSQVDKVTVGGKPIRQDPNIYLILNKPRGYITTKSDTHGRKTVFDLLPKKYKHLHSVGRLDKDTSGLLLFTNDGKLTNQITHPSHEVSKKYQITIRGRILKEDKEKFPKGFQLPDFDVAPCELEDLGYDGKGDKTKLRLTIREGKKREIRKIFEFLGYDLIRLHRSHIGKLTLRGLSIGKTRILSEKEVKATLL